MDIRVPSQKLIAFQLDIELRGVLSHRRQAIRTSFRQQVFNFKVYYVTYISFKSLSHTILAHIIFVTE